MPKRAGVTENVTTDERGFSNPIRMDLPIYEDGDVAADVRLVHVSIFF